MAPKKKKENISNVENNVNRKPHKLADLNPAKDDDKADIINMQEINNIQTTKAKIMETDHQRCFIHRLRDAMDVRNGVFSWSEDGLKVNIIITTVIIIS